MKPGQGKNKGGEFERWTAKKLSLWLSNNELEDVICRSESSGARFTSNAQRGKSAGAPGDLMAKHPLAFEFCNRYVVECKHWKSLEMHQFLAGYGELHKAMEKVKLEALRSGKMWLLIARQNHQPTFLFGDGVDLYFENALLNMRFNCHHILFRHDHPVHMLHFENFLNVVTPQRLIDG